MKVSPSTSRACQRRLCSPRCPPAQQWSHSQRQRQREDRDRRSSCSPRCAPAQWAHASEHGQRQRSEGREKHRRLSSRRCACAVSTAEAEEKRQGPVPPVRFKGRPMACGHSGWRMNAASPGSREVPSWLCGRPRPFSHGPVSPCSALGPLLVSKEYSAPSTTNLPCVYS